jgi:type I restriction enzyme S subunit
MKKATNTTALGDVVELVMGQAPPSKDTNFEGKGTPFVKVGEFGELRPVIREWTTTPLRMARRTDVLLCVVGATCGKINLGEDCAIGRSVAAIRPNPSRLDQFYLYYFMMTLVERLRSGSVGAAQTVISKEMVQNVEIPSSPLSEQQRIVGVLDEAFDGLATTKANAEKNLQNARALFESHLQSVFTQRGNGWVEKKIGEIADVFDGPHATPKTVDSGPVFLGISALQDGRVNLSETRHVTPEDFARWTRRVKPKAGDVVFSYETRLGQAAIIPAGLECCLGRRMGLVRVDASRVDPRFFVFQYVSPPFRAFLASRTVRGATVDRIALKEFPSFPILVPPINEQQAIVIQLDALAAEAQRLAAIYEQKLAALEALKKSLLHQAFSGEL